MLNLSNKVPRDVAPSPLWRRCLRQISTLLTGQPSIRTFAEPFIQWLSPAYVAGYTSARVLAVQQLPQGWLVRLKVAKKLHVLPGQHVDVRVCIDGRFVDRTFTICSDVKLARQDRIIELAIRAKSQGCISQWLTQGVGAGHTIWLGAVGGDFVLDGTRPALMVAAGSGITPFRAMLLSLSRLTQPVRLLYIVPTSEQIWFQSLWDKLQQQYPLLQVQFWCTEQQGRPQALWIVDQATQMQADLYICGPTSLYNAVVAAASTAELRIHGESFGVQAVGSEQQVSFVTSTGQQRTISATSNLLTLAEQVGFTPTYGCRRGVCQQCQCDKQQGQVKNLLTGELSGFGKEAIQLCISQAVTDVTVQLSS